MKYYQQDTNLLSGRAISLIAVIALHAVAFYVLANATSVNYSRVTTLLYVRIIPQEKPKALPPPPPPSPQFKFDSPIIHVMPPDIKIAAPVKAALIQDVIIAPSDIVYKNTASPLSGPITEPHPISGRHGADSYPAKAEQLGETGRTEIIMCISAKGLVNSVKLVKSTGFPLLDQAALSMAKDYRFRPATQQGKPIAVCRRYGFAFGIDTLPK